MSKPAIVIIAYNRDQSLKRLLKSLALGIYPSEKVTLHISIDASDNPKVKELADGFEWKFGEKIIDLKSENLGLLKHVLSCGQLTEKYESVIVLEDDLVVAPGFYQYAQKANEFYAVDDKIAGISLFTYPVEENNFYPFQPIRDESDVHFIQVASSWGQSWSRDQWSKFTTWLEENENQKESLLPDYILNWGSNSWKKLFINYLIDSDRYFVFPTTSYSNNFEDEGTHATRTSLFQVPMSLGVSSPRFKYWKDSNAIYDVYFELIPAALKRIAPQFSGFDLEVDLYGKKPTQLVKSEYLLTIRRGENPVLSYGTVMEPLVQNVVFEIEGEEISLINKLAIYEHRKPERFVNVSESLIDLKRNSDVFVANNEHVTIVIPADDPSQLQITLEGLSNDRFYNVTLLVSCQRGREEEFAPMLESLCCSSKLIPSHGSNLNQLLRSGFNQCESDYVSWAQAGMEIHLEKFERVSSVLSGMKQVSFLRGIDEEIREENYLKQNSAPYRWTAQLANKYAKESCKISTELMVWRRSIMDEIATELEENYSDLFITSLKVTPLYVFMEKLGDRKRMRAIHPLTKESVRDLLSDEKFHPKKGLYRIARPFFRFWFHENFQISRLFFKEIEKLPMVIRYDFKNDSYFLDNY